MPRASKVTEEEKDTIAQIAYALKEKNPQIGPLQISKKVNRSPQVVTKVLSDKRFEKYKLEMKKRIDQIRFDNIVLADKLVKEALKEGTIKPYQAIGASKVYYEQSFGLQEQNGAINVSGQAVQVIRGNVAYNSKNEGNEVK